VVDPVTALSLRWRSFLCDGLVFTYVRQTAGLESVTASVMEERGVEA